MSGGVRGARRLLFLLLLAGWLFPPPAHAGPDVVVSPRGYPFTFVTFGDIRFTSPANTRSSNPEVRHALVAKVAKERPAFAVIVGDIVLKGASAADWAEFDEETRPWQDIGLQVFPVLGNHELEGGESTGLANYFSHFPAIAERRWYSLRAGNVLLLAIDSDSNHSPGSQQFEWLRAGLESVPSGVDFILIALHHPPYTDSIDHLLGGGHSARTQEKALAQVLQSAQQKIKARIVVVSGHVHNYERYERGGIMYVVSGGGGGTPYMVPRRPGDFYAESGPTYHFCKFTVTQNQLQFQMMKYLGPNEWAVKDHFELNSK